MGRKTTPLENNQPRPDCFQKVTAISTAILGLTALVTNFQTCRALHEGRDSAHAAQRAYVAFGSKTGQLAELSDRLVGDKPIIILHFLNTGLTTARHFTVHVYDGAKFSHIHRFQFIGTPLAEREGTPGEMDLAAHTEHAVYVTNLTLLKQKIAFIDPKTVFIIKGEFEYCDIFGAYHCQEFSTQYSPVTGQFDSYLSASLPCLIEQPDPKVFESTIYEGKRYGLKEIEQCEQPGEAESHRIAGTGPSSVVPTATPTR